MSNRSEFAQAMQAGISSETDPSIFAEGKAIPSDLGRGFLSTLGLPRTLILIPDSAEWESASSIPQLTVDLIDDRSSFAKAVSWSASAKFGYTGGSASVRASMSQKYRRSQQSIDMVLTKVAHTNKHFIRDPQWRREAIDLLKKDSKAFTTRYGDKFIKSVTLGGLLSIVYHLDFSSVEEAEDFRLDADVKYGSASGGASFHSKLLKTATRAAISLEAIASGVTNAPPVFQQTIGVDKATGKIDGNDPLVTALLEYFDDFEEAVQATGGIPVLYELDDINNAANAPTKPRIELSSRNEVLAAGADLDDVIDERMSVVTYMKNVAASWNPQVAPSDIAQLEQALAARSKTLGEAMDRVAGLTTDEVNLPFLVKDVEEIPFTWNIRRLVEMKRLAKTIESFKRARWTGEINLTGSPPGRPISVDISAAFQGFPFGTGTGSFEVHFSDAEGKQLSEIVRLQKYSGAAIRKYSETVTIAMSSELAKINVGSQVENARLRIVVILKG